MALSARARLPADIRAPGAARRFVTATLAQHPDAVPVADILTVVSELVTNAVRAGAELIDLHVQIDTTSTRIEVSDNAAGWPTMRHPSPVEATGRGLMLVDALAESWGVGEATAPAGGKQVWASVDHRPQA